jgi:hypothetical protein
LNWRRWRNEAAGRLKRSVLEKPTNVERSKTVAWKSGRRGWR